MRLRSLHLPFLPAIALFLSACAHAPAQPTQTPREAWSVSVHCEPLNVSPVEYRCDATVKSLTADDHIVVSPVVLGHNKPPVYYYPPVDSRGRIAILSVGLARDFNVLTWILAISQNKSPLLEYSGFVDLRSSCSPQ